MPTIYNARTGSTVIPTAHPLFILPKFFQYSNSKFVSKLLIQFLKMKTILIVSVVLLIALVANTEANGMESGPNFDCVGKSGYFADNYRLCHVFYYCYPDGRKIPLSCPDATTFNQETGRCEFGAPCAVYLPQ